jgi:hypothetical protein
MKKLLLAAVLIAVPFTTQAESAKFEICEGYSSLAETIMEGRQVGVSMAEMVKIVTSNDSETGLDLIMRAYKLPRFSSDEMQQRSAQDFGNDVFLDCYK